MITPVIMAGGSGTRLWPLSRAGHPKQFLALNGDKTMLQQTVERLADLPVSESITICNEEHRFFVAEQLREIGALGKMNEFKIHTRGALTNGVSKEEIRAAIHVVSIYCGVPQGLECFRAAREVLEEAGEL